MELKNSLVFTRARHSTIFRASWIHSLPQTSFFYLASGLLLQVYRQFLYVIVISPTCPICPSNLIFNFVTLLVTGYCYGVVPYKSSHALLLLLICYAPRLISNHSRSIRQISLLLPQQRHLLVKRGETWREMSVNFAFNTSENHTTWDRGLYFPPE
jgi:hypothetical protein